MYQQLCNRINSLSSSSLIIVLPCFSRKEEGHVDQQSNGRQRIVQLLVQQKQAISNLNMAKEEFRLAEERVANAKVCISNLTAQINTIVESSLDELMVENNSWNTMFCNP